MKNNFKMETLFLKSFSRDLLFYFCEMLYSQQLMVSLDELQAYIWQFSKLHFCLFAINLFAKKLDAIAVLSCDWYYFMTCSLG